VLCAWVLQDGDSLSRILQPYLYTGVNLTTFRFRHDGSVADAIGELTQGAEDNGRYDDDFTTVYDSLLTLYHGVRLQWHGGGGGGGGDSCKWEGNNLLSTLAKVSISV